MLKMPSDASSVANILAFDPGTNCLGVAVLSFDVETLEIVSVSAKTLVAAKHTKNYWSNQIHGDRFGRINWLEDQVVDIMYDAQPFQIVVESPFFNRMRPNAFEPLVQIKFAIQRAVARYTAWKRLYEIDPPTVKNAVGAKGNADKETVQRCVLALDLPWSRDTDLFSMDEHSFDATAAAVAHFKMLLEESCLN